MQVGTSVHGYFGQVQGLAPVAGKCQVDRNSAPGGPGVLGQIRQVDEDAQVTAYELLNGGGALHVGWRARIGLGDQALGQDTEAGNARGF